MTLSKDYNVDWAMRGSGSLLVQSTKLSLYMSLAKELFLMPYRVRLNEDARHSLNSSPPKNYRWVRVGLHKKGSSAAVNKALDTLNFLIGLWNLILNHNQTIRTTYSGPRKPVNSIVLGPLHTIHKPSGEIGRNFRWYEPNYCGAISIFNLRRDITGLLKHTKIFQSKIKKI